MSIFFDIDTYLEKPKIIVKKKDYPLAVERNKIKRWIREIFNMKSLNAGYVVVVRDGFLQMGFKNISKDFNLALDNFVNKPQDD